MVSRDERDLQDDCVGGAGLLSVKIQGATSVEGKRHSNPYAVMHFRGEKKKTKVDLFLTHKTPCSCHSYTSHFNW